MPEGGLGFRSRLQMAIADKWIKILETTGDHDWEFWDIVQALNIRHYAEPCLAHADNHNQVSFWPVILYLIVIYLFVIIYVLVPGQDKLCNSLKDKIIEILNKFRYSKGSLSFDSQALQILWRFSISLFLCWEYCPLILAWMVQRSLLTIGYCHMIGSKLNTLSS